MFSDRDFGMLATAMLLTIFHWAPWPKRLHRLAAYTCGVASILAGQAIWLLPAQRDTWQSLVFFAIIGGLATGLCYLIDWGLNARLRLRNKA